MANLQTRYARALFELSLERGLTSEYMEQAAFLRDAINNHEYHRIITHPQIPQSQKADLIQSTFAGRVHDDLLGFMQLTITKNRERYLTPALDALVNMIRRHQKYVTARVISAVPLSQNQESRLRIKLAQKLNKQVELSVKVDESIIGGFRIHVDGHVFDRTIRRMLRDIKNNLISNIKD